MYICSVRGICPAIAKITRRICTYIALFLGKGKLVILSHPGRKRLISFDDKYKLFILPRIIEVYCEILCKKYVIFQIIIIKSKISGYENI